MNTITKSTIHAFRNRTLSDYGEGQYVLAWHAAFPVGFTPDMLYQLWANFRHDPGGRYPAIPMIAVNDLLMSALCRPVGNDIYEMEADIRSYLLEELRSHLPDRLIELAFFLENYANYQLTDTRYRQFRETLLINASATSNPAKALKAISVKLQEALAQNDKAEVMRLRELLEVFARHEKGGDHMSESVFYPWLQYTVALKGGYLNAPESMVQQKLNDIDSVTGKSLKFYAEKPGEGAISIPLPESLFRKNVVREITVEEETTTEERPPALHAILTGIDQYEQLPSLAGCENDMNLWKNYLEKKFGNSGRDVKISLLRNNSATSRGILQRFRAEVLKARPGDFIFFAFSGHASHERVAMIHAFDTFWAEGGMQNVLTEEDFLPFIEKNSHINFVFLLDGEGLDAFFSEPRENLILLSGLSKGETSFELKIDGESYGIFTSTAIRALGMLQDLSYWNFIDLTRRMIAEADGTQTPQIQCTPGNEFKTFLQDHLVSDLSEAEERIRICREKGLNKLDLTGLGLTRLPEGIGSLTQLETIDLFDNFLTFLPGEIGELKDLKALLASKNRIGSLPASLQNLEQLETIKLDGNRLETFPEVLLNMRGLQYISLEDNFIDVVPRSVVDLPNLRSFDVRNNPVFNIPKGKKKFTRGALQSLFAQMDPERDGPMQIAVLGSWDECETIRKSLHEVIDGRKLDVIYLEGSPVEWYQQVTPMAHNMIALHIEYDKDNEKLSEFLNFDEVDRKKLSLAQLRNLMSHPGPARFCFLNYDNSEKDQEEMLDGWGFDQCICYKGTPRTQLNVSSFIASFYRHLADGNTVQEAHKKATEDVVNQLRNTSAAEGIVCTSREGADLSWKLSDLFLEEQQTAYSEEAAEDVTENEVDTVIEILKELIATDKIGDAIDALMNFSKAAGLSSNFENNVILLSGQYRKMERDRNAGNINPKNALATENRVRSSLLSLVDDIKEEVAISDKLKDLDLDTGNFILSERHIRDMQERSNIVLGQKIDEIERIVGLPNRLASKKWLLTGLKTSESVGRIHVKGYGFTGTGFLLKNGYVMTSQRVLPDREMLYGASIQFNFTRDEGNNADLYRFELNPEVYFSSPYPKGGDPTPGEYGYAVTRLRENGQLPLSNLGTLDMEPDLIPQPGEPMSIIRPEGEKTQAFSLTAHEVVDARDHNLYYIADLERESDGAPVFNQDWKIVALHLGERNEEGYGSGSMVQTKIAPSNRGILIRYILDDLRKQGWES